MNVKKNEILADLKRVIPGIATGSSTLEGADSFVFTEDNKVYSYNSTVSVMVPLSQELNLKGTVKADDFYKCIQKMPDDFEIETSEKSWTLKCGKIKVKVNLLVPVDSVLDRFEQLEPTDDWIEIPDNEFFNALVQCNMPDNKTQYSGVFVYENGMVSSDSLQINHCELKAKYPAMWISNSAVAEILKWNDFTKVQLNKTWLQFTNGTLVFSVKTLFSDNVPQVYNKIIGGLNKINSLTAILAGDFTDEVYAAIDRATTFSESVMNRDSVIITFEKDYLKVSANRTSGCFEEMVKIGTEVSEPVSFALALSMLNGVSKYYKHFELISVPNNPPRLIFKNDFSLHLMATLKM